MSFAIFGGKMVSTISSDQLETISMLIEKGMRNFMILNFDFFVESEKEC